jgi:choline dehydrogenase-like flavoprotein
LPLDLLVAVQRPASRGTVRLASADPLAPPAIDQRYLSELVDRCVLRDGVRAAAALIGAAGGVVVDLDDSTLESDAPLDRWIRDHLATAFHLCGTAPFGPDDDVAVTRPDGRVRGVDGLRVVDLSVLPSVPSRGPAATAIMIGELLAAPPGR